MPNWGCSQLKGDACRVCPTEGCMAVRCAQLRGAWLMVSGCGVCPAEVGVLAVRCTRLGGAWL